MSAPAPGADATALVEHFFRHQSARLVAALARRLGPGGLDLAEDVVQDALVRALRTWPFRGVPDDPAAWLYRVAHRRAVDVLRQRRARDGAGAPPEAASGVAAAAAAVPSDAELADAELALVFACCHPAVPREGAVALTLKVAGGFGVGEIARAFLADEAAVAQRIVRAKRRLREGGVALAVPGRADELAARLPAVLDVLYLLFAEGHAATGGDAPVRRELCHEALRLARLVARHPATSRPEAHALAALFCFQAARLPARTDGDGGIVLLAAQDRSRWDAGLVACGFRHLDRAAAGDALTRWHVEAEIASLHAAAPSVAATDWARVRRAYDALLALGPSPVARVQRAVATGMLEGPRAALAELAPLADDARAARYPWYHAVRAHWLARAGERAAAAAAYRAALAAAPGAAMREFLSARLAEAAGP